MANRTLGTRQKLVFRGPDKGPGKLGVAGPQEKTAGTKRQEKRFAARQLQKLRGVQQAGGN
jgi:hypothetical protein